MLTRGSGCEPGHLGLGLCWEPELRGLDCCFSPDSGFQSLSPTPGGEGALVAGCLHHGLPEGHAVLPACARGLSLAPSRALPIPELTDLRGKGSTSFPSSLPCLSCSITMQQRWHQPPPSSPGWAGALQALSKCCLRTSAASSPHRLLAAAAASQRAACSVHFSPPSSRPPEAPSCSSRLLRRTLKWWFPRCWLGSKQPPSLTSPELKKTGCLMEGKGLQGDACPHSSGQPSPWQVSSSCLGP